MSIDFTGYAIVTLVALAITGIGLGYVLRPLAMAVGFGLPSAPEPAEAGWLNLKGIRDIVSGLVLFMLLFAGDVQLLASIVSIFAIVPAGDAATIVRHHGSRTVALTIHASTAAVLLVAQRSW